MEEGGGERGTQKEREGEAQTVTFDKQVSDRTTPQAFAAQQQKWFEKKEGCMTRISGTYNSRIRTHNIFDVAQDLYSLRVIPVVHDVFHLSVHDFRQNAEQGEMVRCRTGSARRCARSA